MRLSVKEQSVLSFLIELQKAGKSEVTIDAIAENLFYVCKLHRPQRWRQALAVTMRGFGPKMENKGCMIYRKSKIGRGSIAVYKFSGNLTGFLSRYLKEQSSKQHQPRR